MKKINLFLFVFLFLSSFAYAVPPVTQVGGGIAPQLQISYLKEVLMINGNYDTHWHVYNSTGFLTTNATTDCYFHLYDEKGQHIIRNKSIFSTNGVDFEWEINTSTLHNGLFPYVIWCNNSREAGFVSGTIEFSHSGKPVDGMMLIGLVIGVLALAIVLLLSGFVVGEDHIILKFLLYGSSLFLMLYVPTLMFNMFETVLTQKIIVAYTWILRLIVTYLFLFYFIYKPLVNWKWIK